MDKKVITELIQHDFNLKALKSEFEKITINDNFRSQLFKEYEQLKVKLGCRGASENTAQLIVKYLKNSKN
jgi:lipid-A-disaccharide synthase